MIPAIQRVISHRWLSLSLGDDWGRWEVTLACGHTAQVVAHGHWSLVGLKYVECKQCNRQTEVK